MICLDTPLLEDLLRGRPRARRWSLEIQDEGEVVAAAVSLLELGVLSARMSGGSAARRNRLEALGRLRRSLTVLPLDPVSVERALHLPPPPRKVSPEARSALGVVGTCLGHGVEELRTSRARWLPAVPSALRVVRV